jgi:mono/diheme cytochrome c family protein
MNRHVAMLSGLLAAALCVPAAFPRRIPAQEPKPAEQKAPEQKDKPAADAAKDAKAPSQEAKTANPVKPDADSIAQGKHMFASQCVMCHGASGDGKGDLAADMKLTMRNWRDPDALKDFTDKDLFDIVTKGKDKMPDQGDRMSDTQKWNVINFIRSLSKKGASEKSDNPAKKEKPPSL